MPHGALCCTVLYCALLCNAAGSIQGLAPPARAVAGQPAGMQHGTARPPAVDTLSSPAPGLLPVVWATLAVPALLWHAVVAATVAFAFFVVSRRRRQHPDYPPSPEKVVHEPAGPGEQEQLLRRLPLLVADRRAAMLWSSLASLGAAPHPSNRQYVFPPERIALSCGCSAVSVKDLEYPRGSASSLNVFAFLHTSTSSERVLTPCGLSNRMHVGCHPCRVGDQGGSD